MDYSKSRQHFVRAIELLASTDASMIDRLRAAHEVGLRHIERNSDLPEHLRPRFDALMTTLDELFRASAVDKEKATGLASEVVMLYHQLVTPGGRPDRR